MNRLNKKNIIIIILVAIILVLSFIYFDFYHLIFKRGATPSEGFVPDEDTAIKIAEAIWLPIYGDSINTLKPFVAKYNALLGYWEVTGTLPPKFGYGGIPEIHIRKKDGKILYVMHGL